MHLYERGYQLGMGVGLKLLPVPKQELITGPGSLMRIPGLLSERGLSRPLIVTGPRVSQTDFFQRLVRALTDAGGEAGMSETSGPGEAAKASETPGTVAGGIATAFHPVIFSEVEPDPTTDLVQRVIEAYRSGECDCFIAVGGGSNMDAAKAAAARIARPEKPLTEMGGVLKVRRKTPFMIAVPTTAGTGSECTVVAAVTDSETNRKFAISDLVLCPDVAVLDADLTASLPPAVVAATGMDALTHAVEAYLNRMYHRPGTGPLGASMRGGAAKITGAGQGSSTAQLCLQAIRDIMLYLPFVYVEALNTASLQGDASPEQSNVAPLQSDAAPEQTNAGTLEWDSYGTPLREPSPRARQKLLEASFRAGQAFTFAGVGNVHAIAHTLGGLYHIPHGQANAALLPIVLEDYGKRVYKPLARMVRDVGLERLLKNTTLPQEEAAAGKRHEDERLAKAFIAQLHQMNREMGLPEHFPQIREADLEKMAGWAVKEANPLYPVPVIYNKSDVKRILNRVRSE